MPWAPKLFLQILVFNKVAEYQPCSILVSIKWSNPLLVKAFALKLGEAGGLVIILVDIYETRDRSPVTGTLDFVSRLCITDVETLPGHRIFGSICLTW